MAKKKVATQEKQPTQKITIPIPMANFVFSRQNYLVLGAGLVILAFGFLLMTGGSQSPDQWDVKVVYGFTRITLSTTFVLIGFGVIMASIFWKSKKA